MMLIAAAFLSTLLIGLAIGYLWGREDGRDEGEAATYQAVERWYETRGER